MEGSENVVLFAPEPGVVLRLSKLDRRSPGQVEGELEFLDYLKACGAPVCASIPFKGRRRYRRVGQYLVCQFELAPGQSLADAKLIPKIIEKWGIRLGELHNYASDMPEPRHRRFQWYEDSTYDLVRLIPDSMPRILAQATSCLRELAGLPASADVYGLIHADLHLGNIHFAEGQLFFFDFDDCCYHWYGYDLATILYAVLNRSRLLDDPLPATTVLRRFLAHFLRGYSSVRGLSTLQLDRLGLLLQLKQLMMFGIAASESPLRLRNGSPDSRDLSELEREIERGWDFSGLR